MLTPKMQVCSCKVEIRALPFSATSQPYPPYTGPVHEPRRLHTSSSFAEPAIQARESQLLLANRWDCCDPISLSSGRSNGRPKRLDSCSPDWPLWLRPHFTYLPFWYKRMPKNSSRLVNPSTNVTRLSLSIVHLYPLLSIFINS